MPKRTESQNDLLSDFTRFYILTILFEGPAHGYKILGRFKESVGKEVSPSLVYPFLEKLEKKGLVKCTITSVGEKERKVFELTDAGKVFCAGLFKRFSCLVSIALEPSLLVCSQCGCKVFEGGYHEVIEGKKLAFCCKHCAHSYVEEKNHAKQIVKKELP
jgi:PadR family transcriptional regulator PadR